MDTGCGGRLFFLMGITKLVCTGWFSNSSCNCSRWDLAGTQQIKEPSVRIPEPWKSDSKGKIAESYGSILGNSLLWFLRLIFIIFKYMYMWSICGFVQWAQISEESRKAGSSVTGVTDVVSHPRVWALGKHTSADMAHMRPAMGSSLIFHVILSERDEEKMEETSVISQWPFYSCRRGAIRFGLIWPVFHKQQLDWRSQQGIQKYCGSWFPLQNILLWCQEISQSRRQKRSYLIKRLIGTF